MRTKDKRFKRKQTSVVNCLWYLYRELLAHPRGLFPEILCIRKTIVSEMDVGGIVFLSLSVFLVYGSSFASEDADRQWRADENEIHKTVQRNSETGIKKVERKGCIVSYAYKIWFWDQGKCLTLTYPSL